MHLQLLIASHERSLRELCTRVAMRMGLEVRAAESLPGVLDILNTGGVDIIVADSRMLGFDGLKLLKSARGNSPEPDVIVLANPANAGFAQQAVELGARDYTIGTIEMNEIQRLLDRLVRERQVSAENRLHREQLDARRGLGALIGAAAKMQKVYEMILRVATTRHPVLVLGESGTGKELGCTRNPFIRPLA